MVNPQVAASTDFSRVPVIEQSTDQPSRFWQPVLKLPGKMLIGLVRLYQVTLSPLLGPTCRFHPSCSQYMIEAVEKYGVFAGGWKGIKRICRCHPFHPGGYDPP